MICQHPHHTIPYHTNKHNKFLPLIRAQWVGGSKSERNDYESERTSFERFKKKLHEKLHFPMQFSIQKKPKESSALKKDIKYTVIHRHRHSDIYKIRLYSIQFKSLCWLTMKWIILRRTETKSSPQSCGANQTKKT